MTSTPEEIYEQLTVHNYIYDRDETHELRFGDVDAVSAICDSHGIEKEERSGVLCIAKNNLPFSFFQDEHQFLAEVTDNHFDKTVIISNFSDSGQSLVYTSGVFDGINFFISNAQAFLYSKKRFKKLHEDGIDGFDFVDFYSDSSKSIVFSSISEKRRLKFEFKRSGALKLNSNVDYTAKLNLFLEALDNDNKHYPIFLKNSLISNLINVDGDKYQTFFSKIDKIIQDANLNFDVYLHELSLDKIKAEYKDYKQKYFANQNSILSKISNHVIALPISIAAMAFSMFKLADELMPLIVVCLGLVGFVVYTTFIISVYVGDIFGLNEQSKNEYQNLAEQEFFVRNPNELEYFKGVRNSLNGRLVRLYKGLKIFTFTLWLLVCLLLMYGIELLGVKLSITAQAISFVGIFAVIAIIHSQFIFSKDLQVEKD